MKLEWGWGRAERIMTLLERIDTENVSLSCESGIYVVVEVRG